MDLRSLVHNSLDFVCTPPSTLRKYARVEGVTLLPPEGICPRGGSNSPAAGAQNLTQFGEKGKNDSVRPYVGRYGDVPRWRVLDTHATPSHDPSELMSKRTMESALYKFDRLNLLSDHE